MSSYIGTQNSYGLFEKQAIIILPGVTEYTLNHRVSGASSILVVCDRLILEPKTDYSISYANATSKLVLSSSLNLANFDGDTTNSTKIYVLYLGKEISVPSTTQQQVDNFSEILDRITNEEVARIAGDASTLTTAQSYTDQKISALVGGSPELLNTLKELSDALGSDENFATTVAGQITAISSALATEQNDRISTSLYFDSRIYNIATTFAPLTYVDEQVSTKVSTSSLSPVATSGSYTDLNNTPIIPTVLDDLINLSVGSPQNFDVLTYFPDAGPSGEWHPFPLSNVARSGSYNDLLDKPTNYATKDYVDQQLAAAQSSITFLLNKVAELESRIEALENPTAGI